MTNANLGAIPLSVDILEKANIGLWAFELDEGQEPRMYVDNAMLGLIGLTEQTTPEKTYHAWYDNIDKDSYALVADTVEKMTGGEHAEVQYPWHHPDGRTMIVRCGGVRNFAYTNGIRIEGTHQNVSDVIHFDQQQQKNEREAASKNAIIASLAADYDYIVSIDAETKVITEYRSTGKTEAVMRTLDPKLENPYRFDAFLNEIIYPQDLEYFRECSEFNYAMGKLNESGVYSFDCRTFWNGLAEYYRFKFVLVPENPNLVILGLSNIDKLIRSEQENVRLEAEKKRIEQNNQYNKIINALAADYSSVYVVNLLDSSLYVAKMSGRIIGMFGDSFRRSDYIQAYNAYIDSAVAEDQKDEMREVFSVGYLREHLKDVSSFIKYYINNNGEYTEMKVVKTNDQNEVVMGFGVKDAEIRQQLAMTEEMKRTNSLISILSDDYVSIFSLNLDTGESRVIASPRKREEADQLISEFALRDALKIYTEKVVHPDDRANFRKVLDYEYLRNKLAHTNRYRFTYRALIDGKYRYTDYIIGKEGDPDSPVSLVAVGFQDVDESARTERQYQEQLEQALAVSDYFISSYVSAYYVDLNTSTYTVLGSAGESDEAYSFLNNYTAYINDYISKDVHPDDREMMYEMARPWYIKERLEKEGAFSTVIRDISGGREKNYRFQVIRGADNDHAAFGFMDITEELKEEKEAQEALEKALAAARSANNAKTAFLNSMSHDIRTPLNAITGYTAMAKKYISNTESVVDYLDKIDVSGKQLLLLINQVLEMSRIESGKIVLREEPCDVIDRAYNVKTLTGADIENKALDYSVTLKELPNRRVLADPSRINQIILNIIGNAIKYTPEGGSIDFTVEELPYDREGYGLYRFTVTDTGIGMSDEFQTHLFEEFARENTSTVSHIQGTGLGMPIVKKLVDLMGGKIQVKSKLGAGTTITVTIPMKLDQNSGEVPKGKTDYQNISFSGKRILLVEDNEMNREIAKDILEESGFVVECAEDGDVAVDMVKKVADSDDHTYYDAVLMDIQMPRMNGYEATRLIRAIPPIEHHLPIIALSANAFEEDRQKSLEVGMDDHIAKPIDVQQLKETLAKYL